MESLLLIIECLLHMLSNKLIWRNNFHIKTSVIQTHKSVIQTLLSNSPKIDILFESDVVVNLKTVMKTDTNKYIGSATINGMIL